MPGPAARITIGYNETLNGKPREERREWAKKVLEQLKEKCALDTDRFVILAGKNYRQDLVPHLPNHEMPMEGLPIGKRPQWLNTPVNKE